MTSPDPQMNDLISRPEPGAPLDGVHQRGELRSTAAGPAYRGGITESPAEPGAAVASVVVILAGVWLVLAPHALGYSGAASGFDAFWNDVVVGIAIALIGIARVIGRRPMLSIANVALGVWLIVMPFALGYGGGLLERRAMWNDIILGIIVIVFSLISLGLGSVHRTRNSTVR